MRREILFRGKDEHGNWHEGYFYQECGNDYIIENNQKESIFNKNKSYQVKPETVGQFTGLLDKNGVMIFEGDIVKSIRNVYVYPDMSFDNPDLFKNPTITKKTYFNQIDWYNGVRVSGWRIKGWKFTTQLKKSTALNMSLEIVGNIHDNQNLLTNAN